MKQEQTIEGSAWMVREVRHTLANLLAVPYQAFDRTPLDIMAFTMYAADRQQATEVETVLAAIEDLSSVFDFIGLCSPEEDWPRPVFPGANDLEFARLMNNYLSKARARMKTTILDLPWDTNQRVALVLDRLSRR